MNIVIYSDKKVKKYVDANIDLKQYNITVLGYETEIRSNFVSRIANHYNPHILVVFDGVKQQKGFDFFIALKELRTVCPDMRIIYLYGNIDNEADFLEVSEKLLPYGIYDIMTFSLYSQGFKKQFIELLNNPMSKADFQKSIEKNENKKNISETLKTEIQKIIDTTPVTFSDKEINADFDIDETDNIDELSEHLPNNEEKISIAVSCVTHNHGVAQTAFELAIMLAQAKNSVALFLSDELYKRYLEFHGIERADNGFTANKLPIFPLGRYQEHTNYKYAVYELTNARNDNSQKEIFEKCNIKIALCTGTEWDISYLEEYLNSPLPYLKEINYCFYPVSQPDFMKYNRQMIKGHCKAYRLRTSPNYTNPCQWNRDVYTDILHRYTNVGTNKKSGLFFMR